MGIGKRGMRDQAAAEQDVTRGGHEISRFVPEIGQSQKREVSDPDDDKDDAEYTKEDQRRNDGRMTNGGVMNSLGSWFFPLR